MKILEIKIKFADYLKRKSLYKLFKKMKYVGKNVYICEGYTFNGCKGIEISDNVWIGPYAFFNGEGGLLIKSGSIISRNVEIWTQNHNYNSIDLSSIPYDKEFINKSVVIGENVWIGSRVIILPGVKIGEGAVIGAGAVVACDIPDYAVVAGNPAKVVKYRNIEQYIKLKNEGKIYLKLNYNFDISSKRLERNV